jgi:murein DD-endopeptidase MepM/ murein hydrolase activator NlpD
VFIPDAQKPVMPRQIAVAKNQSNRNMAAPSRREAPRPEAPQPRIAPVSPDRIALNWPLQGSITSSFGTRTNPLTRERSFHTGIDIGVPIGTEVRAAEKGKVLFSGWKDSYGNMIIIRHERGYITVYAHNKKNIVTENDEVNRGDLIALSGMTGSVTGPHLHFELRKHLTPLNPRRFMR